MVRLIEVEKGHDKPVYFVIERVDHRLQLFEFGYEDPVFVRTREAEFPASFRIRKKHPDFILFGCGRKMASLME